MTSQWNVRHNRQPPIQTVDTYMTKSDIINLRNICSGVLNVLRSQNGLQLEGAILSRYIYRVKASLSGDKSVMYMKLVSRGIKRYYSMNLSVTYDSFFFCLPSYFQTGSNNLPSRQMLEYLLIRTQGLAKLFHQIVGYCESGAFYLKMRFRLGHLMDYALFSFSLLSRVWVLSKNLLKCSCEWFSALLPYVKKLNYQGPAFLPAGYEFPVDFSSWLDDLNLKKQSFDTNYQPDGKPTELICEVQTVDLTKTADDSKADRKDDSTYLAEEKKQIPLKRNHLAEEKKQIPSKINHLAEEKKQIPLKRNHLAEEKKQIPSKRNHLTEEKKQIPLKRNHLAEEKKQIPSKRNHLSEEKKQISLKRSINNSEDSGVPVPNARVLQEISVSPQMTCEEVSPCTSESSDACVPGYHPKKEKKHLLTEIGTKIQLLCLLKTEVSLRKRKPKMALSGQLSEEQWRKLKDRMLTIVRRLQRRKPSRRHIFCRKYVRASKKLLIESLSSRSKDMSQRRKKVYLDAFRNELDIYL